MCLDMNRYLGLFWPMFSMEIRFWIIAAPGVWRPSRGREADGRLLQGVHVVHHSPSTVPVSLSFTGCRSYSVFPARTQASCHRGQIVVGLFLLLLWKAPQDSSRPVLCFLTFPVHTPTSTGRQRSRVATVCADFGVRAPILALSPGVM